LPALGDGARTAPGKRVAQLSLRGLRNDGVEPRTIVACMAGFSSEEADPPSLAALAERFDLAGLASARCEVREMLAMNRRVLRGTAFADVADRLPGGATETFWLAVRGSLDLLKEARGWWDVVAGTIVPPVVEGERDLLGAAEALLPPEPWDASVWVRWIAAIEQATGRADNSVLPALRLALTGEDSGPDLGDLLPLIGRSRTASRLRIAAA
jgi:glutamyl-tRNA synthetase